MKKAKNRKKRGQYPSKPTEGESHSSKIFKSILLVTTALATSVGAYVAYKSYIRDVNQPKTIVAVYRVDGSEELYYSYGFVDLKLKEVNQANGFVDYDLPLKVINESEKDAEGITVWIRAEGADLIYPVATSREEDGWSNEQYANKDWGVINIDSLSPNSGIKLHGVRLHIKEEMHEATLLWGVFSFHAQPSRNSITIHF